MLCSVCHRQLARNDARCRSCGTPRDGTHHLDLVLPGGERVPLDRPFRIGRGSGSELRIKDPSVSRKHARIELDERGASLADAGSSYGTFVDGRLLAGPKSLRPGMRIELGDCQIDVAERLDAAAAGRTVSVPAGISLVVEQPSVRRARMRGHGKHRPRLRSGWSLKRLEASEGDQRYVLKDHGSGAFVRLGAAEAELTQLLDGSHDLGELIGAASERFGPEGPPRLARLLAELADRGLLADIAQAADASPRRGWLHRLTRPRERPVACFPRVVAAVYRLGGFVLFTRPALAALSAVALAGLVAFVALIAGRYGTPFLVARRVGLGALVFVLGRFLIVLCHELAHGLTAESVGRPASRAGIKLVLVFPYAFVDTTDAWFESRRRRIAISLAGPASDAVLGGAFALACWLSPPGGLRDILFQIALGGYVGAMFNLNPLLERDGYHVLVDALREPGLRSRARRRLAHLLSGHAGREPQSRRLLSYAVASLCWSGLTVALAVVLSLRYFNRLAALAPPALVWTVLAAFYILLVLPLAVTLLGPLWSRGLTPATPAATG